MPTKPTFSPAQQQVIKAAAQRVWRKRFKWMKKTDEHPAGQEAMALALGISQQSVSALLKPDGKYNPGEKVAAAIANLDGQTLQQLIGDYESELADDPKAKKRAALQAAIGATFENLEACIRYHAGEKEWSPWTLAAARGGFFGPTDFPAREWTEKLDHLEKALERARKAS